MKVAFKNNTATVQQINTIKEGFSVEPGKEIRLEWDEIATHERERVAEFLTFDAPKQSQEEKKPAAQPKAAEKGGN